MNNIFIVAECGINHNGDLGLALQMIKEVRLAGADSVKFQKRTVEKVYSKEELEKCRESPWGNTTRLQKEGLEFGKEQYDIIDTFCKNIEMEWFASSWDLESVEFIKQYNCRYNKIASPMLTYTALLEKVAEQRKYTFISTGGSTLEEIKNAIKIFYNHNCPFELMHCNSSYPCLIEDSNLLNIETLRKEFNCKVGFSSHSVGIIVPVIASALGATSIEAHLTLDRSSYGSDQSASLEPIGFKKMVDYIRVVEKVMGTSEKKVTEKEIAIMKKLRRNKDYQIGND